MREVAEIALPGFVNGLAIARTGRFLLCATGQEHRLGRWERVRGARNAVFVVPVPSLEAACEFEGRLKEARFWRLQREVLDAETAEQFGYGAEPDETTLT